MHINFLSRYPFTFWTIPLTVYSWPGLPIALPSPASPSAVIVSPETLSRHSSSSPSRVHRPPQFALALPCSSQPIPAVCYPAPTFLEVTDERKWKNLGWWVSEVDRFVIAGRRSMYSNARSVGRPPACFQSQLIPSHWISRARARGY